MSQACNIHRKLMNLESNNEEQDYSIYMHNNITINTTKNQELY